MKKVLAIALSVLLLISAIPPSAVFATGDPTFVVGSVSGKVGDTVVVPITTEGNPGIVALLLSVGYDADALEVTGISKQDFTSGLFSNSPLTNNPLTITWNDSLSPNNTTDGVVANITFTIKAVPDGGQIPITLSYDPDDVYDANFENVAFATQDGIVTVETEGTDEPDEPDVPVVPDVTLESISISSYPTKTVYQVGEEFDPTGLMLDLFYSDGSRVVTDSGYTIEGFDSSVVGDCWPHVSYGDCTVWKAFCVTVEDNSATEPDVPVVPDVPDVPDEPDEPVVDETPLFVVDDATASVGDTFTVAVRTQNNPGITSLKLQLGYDADVLEVVSIEQQDFTGGVFGTSPLTNNPVMINWVNSLSGNNTTNGSIANVTFAVKSGSDGGQTAITLSYDPDDVYDADFENVTFATQNGTVTVEAKEEPCAHANTTEVPAKASTCTEQGHAAYTTCDDCGEIVSGSNALLPLGGHTGGSATCQNKANCSVCGEAYGEFGAHALTHHAAVAATHAAGGNIEYWSCDECGKYFTDAAGAEETTASGVLTSKIPHDYSDEWSDNDTQHWHECECGDKVEVADHVYDNTCDTSCNICGHTRLVIHTWEMTWTTDGANHWHKCVVCGETKDVAAHAGGTATCKVLAACEACGASYGEYAEHDYSAEIAEAKYLKSAATTTAKAVYYKSCTACGLASTSETFEYGEPLVDENMPTVTVERKTAKVGSTVLLTVSLENNPGIWGMSLDVHYDKSQLTLTNVENGTVFSSTEWTPGNLAGDTYTLLYAFSDVDNNNTKNGVLATLEFTVNENATVDSLTSVEVLYEVGNVTNVDFEDVTLNTVSGGVDVINFIYGDLDGSGRINIKDCLLILKYLANNETPIDMLAADVFYDGKINIKDALLLKRYMAGHDVQLGA